MKELLKSLTFDADLPEEMEQERIEVLPCVYVQATSKKGRYFMYDWDGNTWADLGARDVYSLVKDYKRMKGWE